MYLNNNSITQRGHNKYLLELRELARENRKNPTKTESLVWNTILKKNYLGFHFLRQKPINRFILDFYSPKLLLDIEIDGGSHFKKENHDNGRDKILATLGIKTIRISNESVINSLEKVFDKIKYEISLRSGEIISTPFLKGRCPKGRGIYKI